MERAKQFSEARYVSLETLRKSGVAVRTTVWVVEDGGVLYVRTGPRSGKVKRIRRNPRVRIAQTDLRGSIKGNWEDGLARFVIGDDAERILGLFRRKYGLQIRMLGWLARITRSRRAQMVVLGIELT